MATGHGGDKLDIGYMGWSSGEEVQADDAYWHRHPIGGIEGLRPSELFERLRLGGGGGWGPRTEPGLITIQLPAGFSQPFCNTLMLKHCRFLIK